ncbi:MAG: hypothetical protein M0C28_27750 [Candidatus Moduliflexus flocculans]|nr:hypothetical protein [Candidatus Moduliflexus flocculans]
MGRLAAARRPLAGAACCSIVHGQCQRHRPVTPSISAAALYPSRPAALEFRH